MAARLDAPVIGAQGPAACSAKSWQLGMSWRYQYSHRHFVGAAEQHEREEEGSEVKNRIHLADLNARYTLNDRVNFTVSVPYLMATRSGPIRNQDRVVIARTETHATGLGDITATARRWMFNPSTSTERNLSLGLGVKLPTGNNSVTDSRQQFVANEEGTNGSIVTSISTVDQSIQPGDGGFGFLVDGMFFQRMFSDNAALYAGGTYLFNPQQDSGVLTYRGRPTESVMSIADQYVARLGVSGLVPGTQSFAFGLGGRLEGVPSEDLIGSSKGFRRPGYSVGIEPSLSYQWGPTRLNAAVPFAVHRNRTKSVSDKAVGGHGDAAFADWVLLLGFTHSL